MMSQVLNKVFGLGVFMSNQRLPGWLSTVLDFQHPSRAAVLDTTIAFLTLSSVFICDNGSNLECEIDEYQEDIEMSSHMSMLVDLESLNINKSQETRFTRALKLLDLKPFVHPVQLLRHARSFNRGANRMRLSKTSSADFSEESMLMAKTVEEEPKE
jgi:hypothetical protein